MTSSQVLALVGLLLSLVGSVLAAWAFHDEWKTHRPGVPMVPVREPLERLFRRPRPGVTHAAVGAVTVPVTMTAHAVVVHGDETTEQRLDRLAEEVAVQGRRLGARLDDLDVLVQATGELLGNVAADVDRLDDKVRDVATGTVRLELVGLFAVAIGAVLAALPAVLGW